MINELFLSNNVTSVFLELLSDYTRASSKNLVKIKLRECTFNSLNIKDAPFIVLSHGEKITNCFDIALFICGITKQKDNLFGLDDRVVEGHKLFLHELENSEDKLSFLNNHLQYNTFCNGLHITVSDLYSLALVMNNLSKLKDEDKLKFCNVFRWALHLQSLKGLNEQLSILRFNINPPSEKFFLTKNSNEEEKKDVKNKKDKKECKESKDQIKENKVIEKSDENKNNQNNNENKNKDTNDKKDKKEEKKDKKDKEEKNDKVKEKKVESKIFLF